VSQTASSRARLSGDPKPPLCGRPAAALRRNVALHPARISRPRSESRGLVGHLRAKCHWRTLPLNRQPQTRRKKPRKLSRLTDSPIYSVHLRDSFPFVRSRTRHAAGTREGSASSRSKAEFGIPSSPSSRRRIRRPQKVPCRFPDTYPRTIVPRSIVSIADRVERWRFSSEIRAALARADKRSFNHNRGCRSRARG